MATDRIYLVHRQSGEHRRLILCEGSHAHVDSGSALEHWLQECLDREQVPDEGSLGDDPRFVLATEATLEETLRQVSESAAAPFYYWLSWYGDPADTFELCYPWWVTGECADGRHTYCAAIPLERMDEAQYQVRSAYYETDSDCDIEWRFCTPRAGSPFCALFPRAGWMTWPDTRDEGLNA